MKIKSNYSLRTVAGENIIVNTGEKSDFKGIMMLNETGVFLWNLLTTDKSRDQLIEAMLAEYDAPLDRIVAGIDAFIAKMNEQNLLD